MVLNSGLPKHITMYTSDPVHLETHTRTPPRPQRGGQLRSLEVISPWVMILDRESSPFWASVPHLRTTFHQSTPQSVFCQWVRSFPFPPPLPPFQYLSIKNTARKLWFSFCPKLLDLRRMRFASSYNESRMKKHTQFFEGVLTGYTDNDIYGALQLSLFTIKLVVTTWALL